MRRLMLAAALVAFAAPLAAEAAGETEIHLTETAMRTMKPDRMRATLRIDVKGASPREVQAALNKRMEAALDKAKSAAGVTASTGAYQVYRSYGQDQPEQWQASETLVLASGDSAAVLALAGELQAAGLALNGIEFYLAPETLKGAEGALTASALAAVKARANAVANDLGMAIDHYGKIDVGNVVANGGPIRPMPMQVLGAARAAGAPPVAEAADATVSLTVNADIVLVPGK